MAIPIRNLYFMFCYAWRKFPDAREVETGVDDCPDVLNLFARLLESASRRLLSRGLDRDYKAFREETRAPRGKLLMDPMIKQQTLTRGAAVCQYDELTADVLHNQIIKATAFKLCRTEGVEKKLRESLATLVRRLGDVGNIRVTSHSFRRVQLSRNTRQYGPLMRLCELVHQSLMPDEQGTGYLFADILKDEVVMSRVFEEFLRNFYRLQQESFDVRSEVMNWEGRAEREEDWSFIPAMLTDITLRSSSQAIILDAKYYREPFERHWGSQKIRSAHLYQLMTYVRHAAALDASLKVGGALVYPAQSASRSLVFELAGHPVGVEVVDFSEPWQQVHHRLLSIISVYQRRLSSDRG